MVECQASRSDRIRGNYENKIRFFASPEKVFEVFSNDVDAETGEVLMTYGDFLHTMTPYNNYAMVEPEHTKAYVETQCNKDEFFKYVDTDNSGQISFVEFCLLLTIYQVTAAQLRRVFKKYPNLLMTKDEFSTELRNIR